MPGKAFCDYYSSVSQAFTNAVSGLKPELGEDWTVRVKVNSKYTISDKLNWNALQEYLFDRLNNNQFKLVPEVTDTPVSPPQPFTDREKFEKMKEDYPFLTQLSFDLELEPEA
ncbi:MAG: hypothetical protein IPM52_00355 [Bacteroidetes bacterium]|nr:hypothetical protein [Bacteroidota bacterium]